MRTNTLVETSRIKLTRFRDLELSLEFFFCHIKNIEYEFLI